MKDHRKESQIDLLRLSAIFFIIGFLALALVWGSNVRQSIACNMSGFVSLLFSSQVSVSI